MMKSIEVFIDVAAYPPDHVVAYDGAKAHTWAELRTYVAYWQSVLRGPSEPVLLAFEDTFFMVAALLACALENRPICLPSLLTAAYLSELALPEAMILTDMVALEAQPNSHQVPTFSAAEATRWQAEAVLWAQGSPLVASPVLPTVTLFTSGSTGQPSAVVKQLGLLIKQLEAEYQRWEKVLAANSVFYASVSHQHILGVLFRLLLPLLCGRPFSCTQVVHPEQLASICGPYVLASSPAFLQRLSHELRYEPANMVLSSGGALQAATVAQIKALLACYPTELYGSSETGGIANRQHPEDFWVPLPGVQLKVAESGCLQVLSPYMAPSEWYQTQDLVRYEAGRLLLLGRADTVVKVAEKRVSLSRINHLIEDFAEVSAAAAVLLSDAERQFIGVVLVLAEGVEMTQKEALFALRERLQGRIDGVALPRKVRLLQALPMNSQSKISMPMLKALFAEEV